MHLGKFNNLPIAIFSVYVICI